MCISIWGMVRKMTMPRCVKNRGVYPIHVGLVFLFVNTCGGFNFSRQDNIPCDDERLQNGGFVINFKFLPPYEKMTCSMGILSRYGCRFVFESRGLLKIDTGPFYVKWPLNTNMRSISSICRVITFVSMGHLVWSTSDPLSPKPPLHTHTHTSSLPLPGSWLTRLILLLIGVC